MSEIEELYDYDVVRRLENATLLAVHVESPLLVLGSSQPASILGDVPAGWGVRRRKGGGGVVLIQPDDLWIDLWIPAGDLDWRSDVHEAALVVGARWAAALESVTSQHFSVHHGSLESAPGVGVACFAGRGPGEVFWNDRKVVGVTQWRVREGAFISTVLPVAPSSALVATLADPPAGLVNALDHATQGDLGLIDADAVLRHFRESRDWDFRRLLLQS
jgi:lipoate-protein ligase A